MTLKILNDQITSFFVIASLLSGSVIRDTVCLDVLVVAKLEASFAVVGAFIIVIEDNVFFLVVSCAFSAVVEFGFDGDAMAASVRIFSVSFTTTSFRFVIFLS